MFAMFSITVPGVMGRRGRMRNPTKPWLKGSFTLLSGNRMPGKLKVMIPGPLRFQLNACEAAPTCRLAGSRVAGSVSMITTMKAVSVPVFWNRMV